MLAMRECARMVTTASGGCTTPFPFEAAIWLLEEQEELFGGTFPVPAVEVCNMVPASLRKGHMVHISEAD